MPENDPLAVFALLDDEYARGILRATHSKAMSARQLANDLDASRPTIYRRINQLQTVNLLTETMEMDADGNHGNVYRSCLDRIVIEPGEDGLSVTLARDEHPADRLTDMWEDV